MHNLSHTHKNDHHFPIHSFLIFSWSEVWLSPASPFFWKKCGQAMMIFLQCICKPIFTPQRDSQELLCLPLRSPEFQKNVLKGQKFGPKIAPATSRIGTKDLCGTGMQI